jgi:hypothetical protein
VTAARRGESAPGVTMSDEITRLLERFGIRSEHWVETVKNYRRQFFSMLEHVHRIAIHCARVDRDKAKGRAKRVFRPAA